MDIILATTNPAKLREMREVLGELEEVHMLAPRDLIGAPLRIEETGKTFEENAILKARAYTEEFGISALADDGGIEIDALDGAPGVMSRRWLGYEAPDETLIRHTLAQLKDVPWHSRGAQLRAVSVFMMPSGHTIIEEGILRGVIGTQPSFKREQGYPFRPLLWIPAVGKYSIDMDAHEHEEFNQRRNMLARVRSRILASGLLDS